MLSLPKELQFGIISADWSGLRFALTCHEFAEFVRSHADSFKNTYSRRENIVLGPHMYLNTALLPNGKYSGYTYLCNTQSNFRGEFLYENDKLIQYRWCSNYQWNYIHQNKNAKYRCFEVQLADYDSVAEYDAEPTKFNEDGILITMWTAGCTRRLVAKYLYDTGKVTIEIEWGSQKVNVRATVKYNDVVVRAKVYPYEERGNLWIADKPNWDVMSKLADGYFHAFVQDESLILTQPVAEENIYFCSIYMPRNIKLPPGFKGLL